MRAGYGRSTSGLQISAFTELWIPLVATHKRVAVSELNGPIRILGFRGLTTSIDKLTFGRQNIDKVIAILL